uniref:Uncharacterized protein n=1 Tax=Glossina pallidipes TaxID=7398 RepID=A0A1A9ZSJ3_GLOPL
MDTGVKARCNQKTQHRQIENFNRRPDLEAADAPIVKLAAFGAAVIPGPELTILDGFKAPVNTLELTITFDGGDMVFVAESNPKPAAAAAAAVTILGALGES